VIVLPEWCYIVANCVILLVLLAFVVAGCWALVLLGRRWGLRLQLRPRGARRG
jgi:hypothetical protein